MKRDSGFRSDSDSPLADSDFFRQVESSGRSQPRADAVEAAEDFVAELDELELESPDESYADEVEYEYDVDADAPAGTASRGGQLAVMTGWLVGATGAALIAAQAIAPDAIGKALAPMHEAGLQAIHLLVIGVVVGLFGSLRNELDRRGAAHEHDFARLDEAIERMEATAHEHRERKSEEELSDSERVLLALERQDGKINNLTRATKLYGKPLVEISKQVSEVANQLHDLGTVGEQVRSSTATIEALSTTVQALGDRIAETTAEALAERTGEVTDALAERTGEVTAALDRQDAKLAEISRGIEAHGRPLREMSEQVGSVTERVEGLVRATADAKKSATELGKKLDTELAQVQKAVGERPTDAPTVDLAPVERSLDALRRELQTIATRLAQIESRPVVASATPQSAAPAAAPAPTPASAPAPAAPSSGGPAGGLAHSIAGERQAPAKNVLGAIAKLKSMRG